MKSILLLVISFCVYSTSFAQDFIYEGPAQSEVRSFWMNAMGLKKTGKLTEGIAMMEAKLAATKLKDPAYKTADMEAELKKWKDKQAAASSNPITTSNPVKSDVVTPQRIVNISSLTLTTAPSSYTGAAKMYVTNYYRQQADAKKFIETHGFNSAQSKIEQMEKSLIQLKAKDAIYNTVDMEKEVKDFVAALETEKYNNAKQNAAEDNVEALNTKADVLLRHLFESTHIGFSSSDEPVMPIRVEDYKNKTQEYAALGTKGTTGQLSYMKKLIDLHIIETNKEIVGIEDVYNRGSGTNWATICYYTIQYHLAYWDAVLKAFPDETDFKDEYKKVADFATKIGSIENMKAKGGAAELVEIKNRKLPATTVSDSKLEKILADGFNAKYGDKATALKVVMVQNGWTTLRNNISGVVTGRERSAKLAYKAKDGKCYLLDDYIFIKEEYIGNSFTNTKAVFNGLFGNEMLCENVR
jgi:hypothetical protein